MTIKINDEHPMKWRHALLQAHDLSGEWERCRKRRDCELHELDAHVAKLRAAAVAVGVVPRVVPPVAK